MNASTLSQDTNQMTQQKSDQVIVHSSWAHRCSKRTIRTKTNITKIISAQTKPYTVDATTFSQATTQMTQLVQHRRPECIPAPPLPATSSQQLGRVYQTTKLHPMHNTSQHSQWDHTESFTQSPDHCERSAYTHIEAARIVNKCIMNINTNNHQQRSRSVGNTQRYWHVPE